MEAEQIYNEAKMKMPHLTSFCFIAFLGMGFVFPIQSDASALLRAMRSGDPRVGNISSTVLDRKLVKEFGLRHGFTTPNQWRAQLDLLGMKPRAISGVRFDSRGPEIIARQGFLPNPKTSSVPHSLVGHVDRDSIGSSNLVSFTSIRENHRLAKMDFFFDDQPYLENLSSNLVGISARLAAEANHKILNRMVVKKGNQFELRNGIEVKAQKTYAYLLRPVPNSVHVSERILGAARAIADEAEAIVPFIAPKFIESYGSVYRFQYGMLGMEPSSSWVTNHFGSFSPFPR